GTRARSRRLWPAREPATSPRCRCPGPGGSRRGPLPQRSCWAAAWSSPCAVPRLQKKSKRKQAHMHATDDRVVFDALSGQDAAKRPAPLVSQTGPGDNGELVVTVVRPGKG